MSDQENTLMRTESRIYGPGLPDVGVTDLTEAYRLGLAHARLQAVHAWNVDIDLDGDGRADRSIPPRDLISHWDLLVRMISDATDDYLRKNGTFFGATILAIAKDAPAP